MDPDFYSFCSPPVPRKQLLNQGTTLNVIVHDDPMLYDISRKGSILEYRKTEFDDMKKEFGSKIQEKLGKMKKKTMADKDDGYSEVSAHMGIFIKRCKISAYTRVKQSVITMVTTREPQ